MSARYVLVCDDCKARAPTESHKSVGSARRLTPKGWTNPRPGCDRCSACSEKRATRAKEENPDGYL